MAKKKTETGSGVFVGMNVNFEFDGKKMEGQVVAIVPAGTKLWGGHALASINPDLGIDTGEYGYFHLDQVSTRNQTWPEETYLIAEAYQNTGGEKRLLYHATEVTGA